MKIDILVAEIGSTTTVINAFSNIEAEPVFLGQGQAATTVTDCGVTAGLENAMRDLSHSLGKDIEYDQMLATSSAAGGLRMTVHGLVYDMTVHAAKEAALGAGANLCLTTAGVLTDYDLVEIERINPSLILLAGGTDYGERQTALKNAERICSLSVRPPVIYAGNIQNRMAIRDLLEKAGFALYIVDNVYPRLDELNIEPARRVIHRVFEEHITKAPGMEDVRSLVTGTIMPTPGAVMECAQLLYEEIGDVIVIDVGGATTDVHSVTEGSEQIETMLVSPEPKAKRTVEGDLGLYINAKNLVAMLGAKALGVETGLDVEAVLMRYEPIPADAQQLALAQCLAWHASSIALMRHAGQFRFLYGACGRKTYAQGKDLTRVGAIVGTGGAFSRMPGGRDILERLSNVNVSDKILLPKPGSMRVLQDHDYIMASLGALSVQYPEAARKLLRKSLRIN